MLLLLNSLTSQMSLQFPRGFKMSHTQKALKVAANLAHPMALTRKLKKTLGYTHYGNSTVMSDYGMESECKAWRPQSESETTIVQLEKDYRHLSGLQGYLCWYTHLRNVYKIDHQTFFRSHSIWYQNKYVYGHIEHYPIRTWLYPRHNIQNWRMINIHFSPSSEST